ncbi:DUF2058 domain-containing protein [Desulfotalea psychrophila]|nr:DUF2058 domain-containing protein [Desulfotalea psychrophila]
MSNPFQDQFLKLGLVDKKQVTKSKKVQHQKKKQKVAKNAAPVVDENALLAQEAQEKKRIRAQELNRQREEKLRKREAMAAVKQIITQNRIEKDKKGLAYHFTDDKKIQRIFVAKEVADQLSKGRLGIVAFAAGYEVVNRAVIEKIESLATGTFVFIAEMTADLDEEDPYAEYQIPDDLMW